MDISRTTSDRNPSGSRPRIALLLGDPNGVGPELAVKLLARADNHERAAIVVFTDPAMLEAGERVTGIALDLAKSSVKDSAQGAKLRVLDLLGGSGIEPGCATVAGGAAALASLTAAGLAAQRGEVDGIVFAPLNKHAMRLAGLAHEDELRFLQDLFGVRGFVSEFNVTQGLWTSRVTSHIPLSAVASSITREGVIEAVRIVYRYLVAAGNATPRIAVAGLNPHAGDGGSLGREEIDIIAPAVKAAIAEGIIAEGPLSPDTMFVAARRGDFHAVVCMYHDQGQIAMKLMGFDHGVTLHGGLPVPVATCASGTAFDIVGRNRANVEGLQEAFELACAIAARARQASLRAA